MKDENSQLNSDDSEKAELNENTLDEIVRNELSKDKENDSVNNEDQYTRVKDAINEVRKNEETLDENDTDVKSDEASIKNIIRHNLVNNFALSSNNSQSTDYRDLGAEDYKATPSRFTTNSLESANENRDAREESQGNNVNDKIKVKNVHLGDHTFDPNQGGNTELSVDFEVDGKVNSGDYFTVQLPKSLNLVGESDFSNVGNEAHDEIVNSNGDVVATEVYNTVTKTVKYTFTDYVNDKKNVKGGFTKPVFADRERIPFSGVYDASVEIAGKQFNDKVDIEYSTPPIGISSSIIKVDNFSGENSYKQSIVVNPNRKGLIRPTVTIQGYHDIPSNSSTTIDKENTNLRIFKVNDISKVPESYYLNPDDSNLEEVTDEFYDSISYDSNSVSIDFADTNNPYVILVDGHYDESNNDIKTRVFLDSLLAGTGEENHEQFDNTFSFSSGSSMADGDEDVEDVKYSPNYGSEVTRPGQSVDLSQTGKVPENAKYEVIQNKLAEGWKAVVDESGKLTVTPSKEIAPGTSEDIPVKVTYSDGTSDEVSGKVTVVSNLADDNNPAYGEVTTKPGK
ncbi:fibrinogen-binding adhesin SdrG C-terminal domain-containing protein, partial [Staphylococcus auricularis]|uniref:fibrinogen-binding adhesin SdrG C-terminal domain-containing protein n=1 Tax=Staphylococcus auricularis TaxID=29379 RepID=UPI00311A8138